MNAAKRPSPLAVRLAPHEKDVLNDVAKQLGTTRNHFVRAAAMGLAKELQADHLVRGVQ